jgi:hypothetical protein
MFHSDSVAVTSVLSQTFLVDGVFGFTRTDMLATPESNTCWGDKFGTANSCQGSTVIPSITASRWTLTGGGQPRAYREPQWGGSANGCSLRPGWGGRIAPPTRWWFASAIPAIRKMIHPVPISSRLRRSTSACWPLLAMMDKLVSWSTFPLRATQS